VLSDFEGKKPAEVLREILRKLKDLSGEEITLRKYIRQLAILARLRNLNQETQKQIGDMGILYDITEDYLYQQGIEKGIEKGMQKGIEKARQDIIVELLKEGTLPIEKIASTAKVSVDYVKQVARELKQ
jgi:predicted transposase YdaD